MQEVLSDLKYRIMETNHNSKKKIKWKKDNSWDLWDNIKCTNIHIIGTQKEKKKEKQLKLPLRWS